MITPAQRGAKYDAGHGQAPPHKQNEALAYGLRCMHAKTSSDSGDRSLPRQLHAASRRLEMARACLFDSRCLCASPPRTGRMVRGEGQPVPGAYLVRTRVADALHGMDALATG